MYYLHILFFALALLTLAGTFTDLKHKRRYPLIFWSVVFVFFAMSFLRWERGPDWETYHDFFVLTIEPNVGVSLEMGFQQLSYWISVAFNDYSVFLFIQGAIIAFCTGWIISKYSTNLLLSMLVFFAISFAGIFFVRQYVAIALTMFAFHFVVQRRFWPFILLLLLAAQFHITAWIFIIAYPVYTMRFSSKTMIVLLICSFVASLLLMQTLLSLLGSMGGFVATKIDQYLDSGADPTLTGSVNGLSLQMMLLKGFAQRALIFFMIFLLLSKKRLTDPLLNGLINFYLLSVILYAVFAPLSIVLARIVNYYEFFIILLIPYFVNAPYRKFNRFVVFLIVVAYLFVRFSSGYNQYPKRFAPFKSVFNKEAQIYME